ncbi:bifunctional diguanylate cyclase/phosphodiesterase [Massilia sp. TS11]|uniref:putative bifunctional diguanylate cyclase/phosphodiesterase n=1 Tax=Massilia sp. TS11 TaxID=2908003 RepID=UPI001EDAB139|nr:EAL domain-containing protein [Massilia sp. TS11]MCG2585271.1 EAL domain-containing protein [Massilia sp. TS11]
MDPSRPLPLRHFLRSPAGIVLVYAVFSLLWIFLTGHLVLTRLTDIATIGFVENLKGFLFVVVTSGLLYGLLRAWQAKVDQATTRMLRQQARLERVLRGSSDGWFDWDLASDRLYYSPRWMAMFGLQAGDLAPDSRGWRGITHPADLPGIDALLQESLRGSESTVSFEARARHKDGHYLPILVRYLISRDASGQAVNVAGTVTDLSAQKQAARRLHQAATVFETTREGVMVTDPNGRITMVNNAFTEISGYSEAEVLGKTPAVLSSGRHDADFYRDMWRALAENGYWCGEIWNRRKSGEVYPEMLSVSAVRDENGDVLNYVGVFADITRIKDSESRLDYLAHHDPLTGLPNRLMLLSTLEHSIKAALREHTRVALLMLDLDRFKDVNDSYGHAVGDQLLMQVSERLRASLREMDTVVRLGGDEFVIVLERLAHPEDAGRIANDIMLRMDQGWRLPNGVEVRINASIGISMCPEHGSTAELLLQQADAAMYQAKQEGRACFRYFSAHLTQAARDRIEIEARLHQAILNEALRVYFQPQVDFASGRIIGAEALVRWHDPEQGLITPDRFIPVAEASGLISDIGRWVLNATCVQGRRWLDAGLPPLTLAVNVSPRQFLQQDIHALVEQTLADTGFPAAMLELELTESALMERGDTAAAVLADLRQLGIRLAIDDFGTGYSSLAYLKRFPVDVLKIDRSFVIDLPGQRDDAAIAATIVSMGHTLGFKVLAEGVETEEQLRFLRDQGCDMFQGYYTSPPVPAERFEALLRAQGDGASASEAARA